MQLQVKIKDLFFYIIFVLIISSQIMGASLIGNIKFFGTICAIIRKAIILLVFIYLVVKNKLNKKAIILIGITFLSFLISEITKRHELFLFFSIAIVTLDYEPKKIIKTEMNILLFNVVFIILLSILGIIENVQFIHKMMDGSIEVSNSLGFSYYSYVPIYMLSFTFMYTWLRDKNIKYIEILIISFLSYVVNNYCQKQLTFYINILYICLFVVFVKFDFIKFKKRFSWLLSILIMMVPFAAIVYASYHYYDYELFRIVDIILSRRLLYGRMAFETYHISLLGNFIEFNGSTTYVPDSGIDYYYIDSGYLQLLFLYGIIITCIVLFIYIRLLKLAIVNNNKSMIIWIACVALYNILGSTFIDFWHNPLFFVGISSIVNGLNFSKKKFKNKHSIKLRSVLNEQ